VATGYRLRKNDNAYGPVLTYAEAYRGLRDRLRTAGPLYSVWTAKNGWSAQRRYKSTMLRIGLLMPRMEAGERMKVAARVNEYPQGPIFTVAAVDRLPEEQPPWAPTYLTGRVNARVARVARVAYAYDNDLDCLGTQVCKRISGTSTWSQHAYGNAIDLAVRVPLPTGFDMGAQDQIAAYLASYGRELSIATLIHRDRVWTPLDGWHGYGGQYHTHIHVDCLPQGTGTPDCA
jgi:hypothetical protein